MLPLPSVLTRFQLLGSRAAAGVGNLRRLAPRALGEVPDPMLTIPLDQASTGHAYAVHAIADPPAGSDWPQRLEEIGFLPGERVVVMARAMPGGNPLAVRVGHSTFALRRAEAACVLVRPWPSDLG